jgi:hypothetical protein
LKTVTGSSRETQVSAEAVGSTRYTSVERLAISCAAKLFESGNTRAMDRDGQCNPELPEIQVKLRCKLKCNITGKCF